MINVLSNIPLNNFGVSIQSEEIVVLGNGPSLKKTLAKKRTLGFIKSKDIMVVNSFAVNDMFFELRPKYICFMDPTYWDKNPDPAIIDGYNKTKENLSKVDWDITIVMPEYAKDYNFFIDIPETNSFVKFAYINTAVSKEKELEAKYIEYKQNLSMPIPQNVMVACIYFALNVGYKKIYLFGADHSWHLNLAVKDDNIVCCKDSHFYDNKKNISYVPFFKNANGTEPFTMRELFRAWMIVYAQYEVLEDYSKYLNSKIYNMSEVSYIDAFERRK